MANRPAPGARVFVIAASYIYSGVLESIDHEYVVITEPHIVYETGAWSALSAKKKAAAWKTAERLPSTRQWIERPVESFGELPE